MKNINKSTENKNTIELFDILNNVDSFEKLEDYLENTLKPIKEPTVADYFQQVCQDKNIKKSNLIEEANLSKSYGYQVINGEKNPSRDTIIKLSLAANLTLDETNSALKIAKLSALYPKNPRDSILIFAIKKSLSVIDTDIALDKVGLNALGDI